MKTTCEANTEEIRLWILNDEDLYNSACEYMKRKRHSKVAPYRNWLRWVHLEGEYTPDGGTRFDSHVCYKELNEVMKSLLE